MSLARRLGFTDAPAYVPVVFTVTAFAAGVQAALIVQTFGGAGYPPTGKEVLGWGSLAIILASAVLHVPLRRPDLSRVKEMLAAIDRKRAVVLEPYTDRDTGEGEPPTSSLERTNGAPEPELPDEVPRLSARVHSPLAAGPVVAPDEVIPITIEAEPETLARDLDVSIEIDGPQGTRDVARSMEGTQIVEGVSFDQAGPFTITVTLTHPRADTASKTLSGRVASYREEVGRLFEELKEDMIAADLDVGPQSTPREVCSELGKADAAEPDRLADLAVELEVALYGDEEIDRATYETVHTAIEALSLERREEVAG